MFRLVGVALAAALATLVGLVSNGVAPAAAQPILAFSERATVLVALQPQKPNGKTWDLNSGADPVLCIDAGCYRSNGIGAAARFMTSRHALGPIEAVNFFGKAGRCTGQLSCAFRGIDMPSSLATLQVIDVDFDRHDRLQKRLVSIDDTCTVKAGRLACSAGAFTSEYSIWVVPERIAAEAGPEALDLALAEGLAAARISYAEGFIASEQRALPDVIVDFYRLVISDQLQGTCQFDPTVMAATFEVAGLMPRAGLHDLSILERFLDITTRDELMALIDDDPAGFWRLHDAIDRMHLLAVADSVERVGWDGGIGIEQRGTSTVLRVDPDVEARARAIIDRCIDGLPVSLDDGGQPRRKPLAKGKTPQQMPNDADTPSLAPTLPLIDPDDAAMLMIIGRAP